MNEGLAVMNTPFFWMNKSLGFRQMGVKKEQDNNPALFFKISLNFRVLNFLCGHTKLEHAAAC